jgi:hypothetical protein
VSGELALDTSATQSAVPVSSPTHHLRRVATAHARYLRNDSGPLGRSRPQARLLSNKTHYSPADPDARISVKPGKARALNYLCSMAVDEGHGLISHIQADFADQRDSTLLPSIVAPLQQRLLAQALPVQEVAADTNYSNGVNYALLEAQGITPWVPVFGRYKPEIEGFAYDKEADCFTCPAGKQLLFKRFDSDPDGRLSKRYSASSRDCRGCPRKPTCVPKSRSARLRARRTMSTTAGRWPGSRVDRDDGCAGCGSVQWSPCLAACSSTTGCAASTREAAVVPTKRCCSPRLRLISRSCSSISPKRRYAWPSPCLSHCLRSSFCAAGGGATADRTGLVAGSRDSA